MRPFYFFSKGDCSDPLCFFVLLYNKYIYYLLVKMEKSGPTCQVLGCGESLPGRVENLQKGRMSREFLVGVGCDA